MTWEFPMDIIFISKRMRKLYENHVYAVKHLGDRNAYLYTQRLQEVIAANNLAILDTLPGRLHPLHGVNRGQYALDLVHPKRLIIEPVLEDDQTSPNQAKKAIIVDIVDYH